MRCPNCGRDAQAGARFCSDCGQALPAAAPAPRAPLVDFDEYVRKATEGFVGREWLDAEVDSFIHARGPYQDARGPLLIAGEPGIGKTAYLAHLVRKREYVCYFCSRSHPGWLDPGRFARSLGQQLAARFGREYGEVLARQEGVHISSDQTIGTMLGGQAIGVYIEYLVASGPQDLFYRLVSEPLQELCRRRPAEPIVLLVDGLEESLAYPRRVTIPDLLAGVTDLPPQVRAILTTSHARQAMRYFPQVIPFDLQADASAGLAADVECYIGEQLRHSSIRDALRANQIDAGEFARTVKDKSENNFLYLRLLFRGIEAGTHPVTGLDQVPRGLDQAYTSLLDHLDRQHGWRDEGWRREVRPVLGILAVAREPLTFDQVVRFSEQEPQVVQDVLNAVELLLEPPGVGGEVRHTIFHSAFADILQDRHRNPTYWIDGPYFHRQIARVCRGGAVRWDELDWDAADDYVLSHLAQHLYLSGPDHFDELYDLINERFREAKNRRFYSDESFGLDLEIAIQAAEQGGLAGLPRVMALSVGQATLRLQAAFTPVPALAMLARAGAEDESLARVQGLAHVDAVEGVGRIAALVRAQGRVDDAQALLRRAILRSVQTRDGGTLLSGIQAALQACEVEDEPAWLEAALEPVVFAIRECADIQAQIQGFLDCASLLARVGACARSCELLEEAAGAIAQVPTAESRARRLMSLAGLWEELGDPERARAALEDALAEAVGLQDAGAENWAELLCSVWIALGRSQEALDLVEELTARTSEGTFLSTVAEDLGTIDDLERAWDIAGQISGESARAFCRVALARRMSDVGSPDHALARLQSVEQAFAAVADSPVGDRMAVRISLAERCLAGQPERSKELLAEALDLALQNAAEEYPSFLDTPTEEALLRLPVVIARVDDRVWAQGALEDTLAPMLDQRPLVGFWWVSADVWRVRARTAVAVSMAGVGLVDRARELIEAALAEAVEIRSLDFRRQALGLVAEALPAVDDLPWVERVLRRLLASQMVRLGLADVEAFASLAHQMLDVPQAQATVRQILDQIEGIIGDLVAHPDSDPELQYHEFGEALKSLVGLVVGLEDQDRAHDALRALWPLALQVEDLEAREELVGRLVGAWTHVDLEGAERAIAQLDSPWDSVVATAALAASLGERGEVDRAGAAIDQALDQAQELTWTDGLALALAAVVNAIPSDAEPPFVAGWLGKVHLVARDLDWRAWLRAMVMAEAFEMLDAGDAAAATERVEVATGLVADIRDPRDKVLAWLEKSVFEVRAEDPAAAEATLLQALASAGEIDDPSERLRSLDAIADRAASRESVAWVTGLLDQPEGARVKDEMLAVLAGRLATLGEVDAARALVADLPDPALAQAHVHIAAGLAVGGMLEEAWHEVGQLPEAPDQAWATAGIARALARAGQLEDALAAADRLTDVEVWAAALGDVVASWADAADGSDVYQAMEAVGEHLATRLADVDLVRAQALVAGWLAWPGAFRSLDGQVGLGGAIGLAAPYLEAAFATLSGIEDEDEWLAACRLVPTSLVMRGGLDGDEPGAALRLLLDRMERDRDRALVVAALARKSLDCELYDFLDDAVRWLLAQETWSYVVPQVVAMAGWLVDWPELGTVQRELGGTVIRTLGDVVAEIAEKDELAVAESVTGQVGLTLGRAYVQARMAGVLRERGQADRADGILRDAHAAMSGLDLAGWPEACAEVAAGLAAVGRTGEALALADALPEGGDRNDVLDAIAYAQADAGELEEALGTLERMSEIDPFDLYRTSVHVHLGLTAVAAAYAGQGDLERAAALLDRKDDLWAILPRKDALGEFGLRLADLALADPNRVAALIFNLLRGARTEQRDEVLAYVAAFASILRAVGEMGPVEAWRRLMEIRSWSAD